MRRLGLAVLVMVGGCAVMPSVAPILEPAADATVWPTQPEIPHYAFVGTLIGERDFVGARDTGDSMTSIFAWAVGLAIGEPKYFELRRPVSGMTDDEGRIYVVDASHQAVVVFDMPENRLRIWSSAADGQKFVAPVGICADGAGGILVTDAELGEVFHLDAAGTPIGRFGRDALIRPTGIARDPATGTIYVTDTGAHGIRLFDAQGMLLDALGRFGSGAGEFNSPTHLAFAQDELYVSDTLNFRVQVFDRESERRLVFGKLGLYIGNLTRPKGVAVGNDGRIYVVESYYDHLLIYDRQGILLLAIGGAGAGVGQFYLPSGVWTDNAGRVYVADMFNGRVVILKEL